MSDEESAEDTAKAEDQSVTQTSWTEGFDDDLSGYIENKGFESAATLAESYRNLEKLHGVPADKLVAWPSDTTDRESMVKIYERMGMPGDAGEYTNVLGEEFNDDTFRNIAAKAHELGLGDSQFQGLQEIVAQQAEAERNAIEERTAADFDAWKSSNETGFNNAARLMADMGVDEAGLEGLLSGDKTSMYDFLAKLAERTNEAEVIHGEPAEGSSGFAMTPAAAKAKIAELQGDADFMAKYHSKILSIREPAIARMTRLHEAASK